VGGGSLPTAPAPAPVKEADSAAAPQPPSETPAIALRPPQVKAAEPAAPVASGGKVFTVLIVEDTVPVQKLLSRWFSTRGCTVRSAENGKIGMLYVHAAFSYESGDDLLYF